MCREERADEPVHECLSLQENLRWSESLDASANVDVGMRGRVQPEEYGRFRGLRTTRDNTKRQTEAEE